jgi:hypothetical protein
MQGVYIINMSKIWIIAFLFISSFNITAQVGIANEDPKTMLDVNGAISFRKGEILNLGPGPNHNVSLGAVPHSFYIIEGPNADFSISGFEVGTNVPDGQIIYLQNTTQHKMKLIYNDFSDDGNRLFISNNQDIVIPTQYSTFSIQYSKGVGVGFWWLMGPMDILDRLEFIDPAVGGLGPGDWETYEVDIPGVGEPPLPNTIRLNAFTVSLSDPPSSARDNITIEYKEAQNKKVIFRVRNIGPDTYFNLVYKILVYR